MPVPIKIANLAKLFSPLLVVLLLNAGCKKSASNNTSTLPAATYLNVPYGYDPYNKMDIYLPKGRDQQKTRLLILIHGGSWSFGDKKNLRAYVQLAQEYLPGYAIANINYRLADIASNKFPVQEDDVKSCVKYLVQYAGIYDISEQFVIFGESAGAHLGLLQAYKHKDIISPIAAVDFYGPTDLKEMYDSSANILVRETLNFLLNGTPANNADSYEESSPLKFATADACPTIIFHGGKDGLVDTTQSVILRNRLNELQVINEFVYYPNEGHGWSGETLRESFVRIKTFLEKNVR
jgi:acetyl esterase/lipase